MSLPTFITIHAVLLLLFGCGFLVAPEDLLGVYGTSVDRPGALALRVFGIGNIQLGLIMWIARKRSDWKILPMLVTVLLLGNVAAFALALEAQLSGMFNPLGWTNVGLYLIFAVGYGAYQLTGSGLGGHPPVGGSD